MKRGFTLLELIVVIIIMGVLAVLAFTQYGRMIERSRGAEAKETIGTVRKLAAGFYLENNTLAGFGNVQAGIGTATDQIPSACRTSNWFKYGVVAAGTGFTATATRCGAGGGGKPPDGVATGTLTLTSDLAASTDVWGGTGGY
jgi:type IV pilus assembly protein PilE